MANYRYSTHFFRYNAVIALVMTGMVAGLVWMLLSAVGRTDRLFWALLASLIFFAFVSFAMLRRYLRRETVLAIQPTGLLDSRLGPEIIAWDDMQAVYLQQREDEFALGIRLWPGRQDEKGGEYTVELDGLDSPPASILTDIARYKQVQRDPQTA